MHRYFFVLVFSCFSMTAFCQAPKTYSSSQIFEQIKKLDVLGSVLYVAAHPDDENTRLLAYLANEKLYRTGYLSMTRGDGGQNLIGDEQGVELGLIRTQELLSARRIDGAEQFFTRAFDFGFTKSPVETFQFWDHDKILSDVVWVIRKFQPDVIIARFPTTGEGGHGHHTASAILAGEAFDAAADPTKFPEQFKYGVKPWQAKRLLWNTFNFGSVNTERPDQFTVDAGGYNSLLGKSYGEIAAESRSQHKSQGFGVPASRGKQLEYFKTIKGSAPTKDLMDGVVTDWERVNGSGLQKKVQDVINSYSFRQPENSVPALLQIYRELKAMPEGYWRNEKLKGLEQVIKECIGLYIEA
ncbi:MAG: PIG-L family deacetylase, partial [Ginsengibacter sp.]